ncbi:hypothetical protein [Natrinema gari]|uniref:Uncharacterized protein n=1 Tax=Natrinema gari JCM 14663 TaxID=1230459 RepID=L9YTB4_9EURY|nr:hypothetical protein [Natrinema gari]ELY77440.1 hypothetical protein C486_15089 [Natrinema gari JCM 14663]
MLDVVVELVAELGFEWLLERNDCRTLTQQFCLFLGLVFGLMAVAAAVVSGPAYGIAVGLVALGLFYIGL